MISFPLGTKMFQFPRFPSPRLCVQRGDDTGDLRPGAGFPHSEIPGSQPAHGSPRLIAVFHVLHRHLAPRHPPYALSSLTQRDAEKSAFFRITIRLLRCASVHFRAGGSPARGRHPSLRAFPRQSNLPDAIGPGTPPGPQSPLAFVPYFAIQFRFDRSLSNPIRLLSSSGGDDGTRTRDFCLAKAALSQLSYIPMPAAASSSGPFRIRT